MDKQTEKNQLDSTVLYTTAEIQLATGLGRGTITNRAKTLGFLRDGMGYTADEVYQIITRPLMIHRRNEANAIELRETLNEKLKEDDLPMAIVERDGEWNMEYWRRGRKCST